MGSCFINGHDFATIRTSYFFDFLFLCWLIDEIVIAAKIISLVIQIKLRLGHHSALRGFQTFCGAQFTETSRGVIKRLLCVRISAAISRRGILPRWTNLGEDLSSLWTLHCTHHFGHIRCGTKINALKCL